MNHASLHLFKPTKNCYVNVEATSLKVKGEDHHNFLMLDLKVSLIHCSCIVTSNNTSETGNPNECQLQQRVEMIDEVHSRNHRAMNDGSF